MKLLCKFTCIFWLISAAVFAADSEKKHTSKIFFVEPLLEFSDYAELDEDKIRKRVAEAEFNGLFQGLKPESEFKNNRLEVVLNISPEYRVVEKYIYDKGRIQMVVMEVGEFNRTISDFRWVRFDQGVKLACKVRDAIGNKLIKENHVLGKSIIDPGNLLENFPVRDFIEDLKLTNNQEEVKGELYESSYLQDKWVGLLSDLHHQKVILYGVWQNEMVEYVFDAEDCALGIYRGKCSNFTYDENNGRGSFKFLNTENSRSSEYEFMKNDNNFFIKPARSQWIRLMPVCQKGNHPRVYFENRQKPKYECR